MNRFKNKICWLALAILASCATANKEEIALAESPEKADVSLEIDRQFSAQRLGRGSLIAFESRAKEKLVDFFNYLDLVSDPKYDLAFKTHAMNLAEELFIDFNAPITGFGEQYPTARQVLQGHLEGNYGEREFVVISIEISQELQSTQNQEFYNGLLSYDVNIREPGKPGLKALRGDIPFNALKVDKSFGDTSRRVWEVLLGESPVY